MTNRSLNDSSWLDFERLRNKFILADRYSCLNERLSVEGVFRDFDYQKLGSILEVGCGNARELQNMSKSAGMVVGVDIRRSEAFKRTNNQISYVLADVFHLPFMSCVFDFAFLKDVVHHLPRSNAKIAIKEVMRTVRCGGVMRIIEANRYHVNSMLVYRQDRSHDHLTGREMQMIPHDKFYGYELLPAPSPFTADFIWNIFVLFSVFLVAWPASRRFLLSCIKLKEHVSRRTLYYYVISKRKVSGAF